MYCVYQFSETGETCVLPTSWVKKGQVKYDSKKASEYVKKGKAPYKKWPTYKVEPLCTKLFDTYDAAYKAEGILLQKSDLETTDVEAITNPTKILKKRRRNDGLTITSTLTAVENYTSDSTEHEDDNANKLPPLHCDAEEELIYDKRNNISLNENFNEQHATAENYDGHIMTNDIVLTNAVPFSLATEAQVSELSALVLAQTKLINEQNKKIDHLSSILTNLVKKVEMTSKSESPFITKANIRWTFPLQTIIDIKNLDNDLRNEESESMNEFKSFLLQIGGTTLKATIKFIVREMYTLELQQKINYSGRDQKFATKNLMQTKMILEVMQLNSKRTQVEAINEYMYHLQHVTDRIRSAKKNEIHNI